MHTRRAISTSDGVFTGYSAHGLCELRFPSAGSAAPENSPDLSAQQTAWHELTAAALRAALAGSAPGELPPLDLSAGTEFRRRVWNALRRIPPGKVSSYSEIADEIGSPAAARAVGQACGANPIPMFIPCHRVLAARHALGGFSGGLDWKRKLLAREGFLFELTAAPSAARPALRDFDRRLVRA